jgi:hypothetical protein
VISGLIAAIIVGQARPHPQKSPFSVVQQNGTWWFKNPSGENFVSLGVCGVDPGTTFHDFDPANPSFGAWRYYPDKTAWATDVAERLRAWQFNTIGPWSGMPSGLYQTPLLNIGATAGAPWKDMWSRSVVDAMYAAAKKNVGAYKGSPQRIGYFSDNELGWWEGQLFDGIWKAPSSGQRAHFVPILASRYKTWPSVLRDFVPVNATRFSDLFTKGRLYLRPGGSGMKAVQAYVSSVADRYYHLCDGAIHAADPGALYLGDRYDSNFYPEVAAASAPYVDVLSTNLNASFNDGAFPHYYLPSLESITQKPLLVSEYCQTSAENRSGNKNIGSSFPVAANQEERASDAEVATRFLLAQPYIVGAHWFQYSDEPRIGGDYDTGLVDTSNRPYVQLTGVFSHLEPTKIHSNGAPAGLDASSGVPESPKEPQNLQTWNRVRGLVLPTVDSQRADLYVSYTADGLYLAVYWDEDRFAEQFYKDGVVPPQDFPEIHVRSAKSVLAVSIPPKGHIKVASGAILVHESRGVRNEVILKFPAEFLGHKTLNPGDQIDLDVGLATRARAYFGRWRGQFRLGF